MEAWLNKLVTTKLFNKINSEILDKIKAGMVHSGGRFVPEPPFYILSVVSGFAVRPVGLCLGEDGDSSRYYAFELTNLKVCAWIAVFFGLDLCGQCGGAGGLCMVMMMVALVSCHRPWGRWLLGGIFLGGGLLSVPF